MASSIPIRPDDETALTQPTVTVRYWAAARAAAGLVEEQLPGSTVSEVLYKAGLAHADNPRFAQVIAVSSFLLGDRPVARADASRVAVRAGDTLEVLPPFAGG
jgi:molybdopterin synthase sulfur carrier subunit